VLVPQDDTVPETDATMATVFLDQEGRAAGIILPHMSAGVSSAPIAATPQPESGAPAEAPRLHPFLGSIVAALVEAGLFSERRAVTLALRARETGQTVLRVLAQDPSAGDLEPIYQFLAQLCGMPLITSKTELVDRAIEPPWLPVSAAEQRGVLLLGTDSPGEAPYAAIDPCDLVTRDWVARCTGKRPVAVPVLPGAFLDAISRLRVRVEPQAEGKALIPIDISWNQQEEIRDRLENCDVPLIVDYILNTAYEQGASDIHIEPVEDGTVIRIRIDGLLHEETRLSLALHPAIASRIKILAGMDVAERRRPQDGRITAQIRRVPLDIRVSSFPTVSGEKIVLRLLDEKALRPAPEQLGLRDENLRLLLDKISAPHGLVMISGPTGAGKTTTLYSCLSTVDRQGTNVLTIEEPVEYRLSGVHQMKVNEHIGLTSATEI
jgi:type IV pilus assembly protein PilB